MDNDEIRGAIFLRGLGLVMFGLVLIALLGLAGFIYWVNQGVNAYTGIIVSSFGFPDRITSISSMVFKSINNVAQICSTPSSPNSGAFCYYEVIFVRSRFMTTLRSRS